MFGSDRRNNSWEPGKRAMSRSRHCHIHEVAHRSSRPAAVQVIPDTLELKGAHRAMVPRPASTTLPRDNAASPSGATAMKRRTLFAVALAAPGIAGAQQAWPGERPLEVVVPVPAGGGLDAMARTLMPHVCDRLGGGARFVVINRPGAGTQVGNEAVSTPPPTATRSAPSPLPRCRRCLSSARSATAPPSSPGSPTWSRTRTPSSSRRRPRCGRSATSPPPRAASPAGCPTAAPASAGTTTSRCWPTGRRRNCRRWTSYPLSSAR